MRNALFGVFPLVHAVQCTAVASVISFPARFRAKVAKRARGAQNKQLRRGTTRFLLIPEFPAVERSVHSAWKVMICTHTRTQKNTLFLLRASTFHSQRSSAQTPSWGGAAKTTTLPPLHIHTRICIRGNPTGKWGFRVSSDSYLCEEPPGRGRKRGESPKSRCQRSPCWTPASVWQREAASPTTGLG